MQYRILILSVAFAAFAGAGVAAAQCPPDCPVKGGGGDVTSDCHVELASDAVRLNSPFFNPDKPKPAKEIRCFDGDPGCDLDGVANNSCTFDIDLCLRNADPSLPSCTPADVTSVAVSGNTSKFPGLAALQSAVDALLPATTNVCTTGESVVVPLKGPSSKGDFKPAKFSFKTKAQAGTEDSDGFKMVCVPRNWPAHGYDAANTRATPLESKINAANVASLVQKWWFVAPTHSPGPARGRTITSTVTVGQKMIYTSSWDGRVYGIDKKKGRLKWMFNTGAANNGSDLGSFGIQSSVTLTADGRVVVADSVGQVYCLDGKKGKLLWQADAATDDPTGAHAWSSPLVANNRVFIGIASHDDAPCTRGNLVAFDLDTGVELWRQYTVPEKICYADTNTECSANADCGPGPEAAGSPCLLGDCDSNPDVECDISMTSCPSTFLQPGVCVGTAAAGECWLDRSVACTSDAECPACIPGKGGGVTATPAASPDGEDIYMASVGCLSFPSIGNSESIFKLDAASGSIDWVHRTQSTEQFQSFVGGPTYHDYGFLNGPILATVDNGTVPVAVAGNKDGTIYAVNQVTGLLEWSNVLAPPPVFAGFGLFNGAVAYEAATDQFFASLYDINTYPASNDDVLSFGGADGAVGWSDNLGTSWSSPTVANGLLFTGNLGAASVFVYDTTLGTQLATLPVPAGNVIGGAAIDNGVLYVPYGNIFGSQGGIVAYELPAAP